MKSKNFNKRLVLNKKTVANLGNNEMRDIQGGFFADPTKSQLTNCIESLISDCISCIITCCVCPTTLCPATIMVPK
jgi:hypothetical protein